MPDDNLTPKQEAFCRAYVKTGNGSEAYRIAYSVAEGTKAEAVHVNACKLLKNAKVALRVETLQAQLAKRHDVTIDRIVSELVKIGFSDIRKLVKWGAHVVLTDDGNPAAGGSNGEVTVSNSVELIGSEVIDDATAAAIAEISQGQHGIKIKMYDKKGALVDLGKHLGMFKEIHEHSGPNGGPLEVISKTMTPKEAAEAYANTVKG